VVSLGIYKQMLHDDSPYVWLDFSNMEEKTFKEDFPYLYGVIFHKAYKAEKRIPVTPAAHYLCGGIDVDANSRASVLGLYAIGEIARTGLHGANRLASNSLLELFYFSQKLAHNISNELVGGRCEVERLPKVNVTCSFDLKPYMADLKLIMWEHYGIIRTQGQMFNGLTKLNKMHYDLVQTDDTSLPIKRFLNSVETAILIATSAIEQKKSIGCHQLKQVKFELTTA
jgi:L-aspartate oxidase